MAKSKNSNSSRKRATSPSVDLLARTNKGLSNRSLKVGSSVDLTRLQAGSHFSAKTIQFGSPSDKGTKNSSSKKTGHAWTGLLESFSTGGISDLLGGGDLIGAGLNFLSSGFANIFGANTQSTVEPLNRFNLSEAQDQTISVDNQLSLRPEETFGAPSGLYDNSQSLQLTQASKAEIVQTIKNALLTSSSLNDVIGEL